MRAAAAILGGGILGALSSLMLVREGRSVRWLATPEPPQREDGAHQRAYALSPRTVALLKDLGVWGGLGALAQPVVKMEVSHVQPSAQVDLLPHASGRDELSLMVLHADLLRACEEAVAAKPQITRREGFVPPHRRVESMEEALAEAGLLEGLVVDATGSQSWLRRASGVHWGLRDYGQLALVARFSSQVPHQGVACQWFRREGILALLPLRDPSAVSMVYSMPSAAAHKLSELSEEDLSLRVTEDSLHRFGSLRLESLVTSTPLSMMTTERFALGRVFWVGDSAHTVHPLAGYGLNLGVEDLLALKDALASRSPASHYNRSRAFRVPAVQWGLDALFRLVSSTVPAIPSLRSLGIQALQSTPPLRDWVVQRVIGDPR